MVSFDVGLLYDIYGDILGFAFLEQ